MHTRKQIGSGVLGLEIALAIAMFSFGCAADKKEAKLPFSDCPVLVKQVMSDHAEGAVFTEVEKETKKDGTIIYEAKGKKADGKEIKIKVASDGHLIELKSEDHD
jgi:hypothetical protein